MLTAQSTTAALAPAPVFAQSLEGRHWGCLGPRFSYQEAPGGIGNIFKSRARGIRGVVIWTKILDGLLDGNAPGLSLAHCRASRPQFGHSVVVTDAQSGWWAIKTAGLAAFNPLLTIVFIAENESWESPSYTY